MADMIKRYEEAARREAQTLNAEIGGEALTFAFITDLHHGVGGNMLHAAAAVAEAARHMRLDFILCGGDISINGPLPDVLAAQEEIGAALAAAGPQLLTVRGNHDDNSLYGAEHKEVDGPAHVVYPRQWRDTLLRGLRERAVFDAGQPDSLYYYVDYPAARTRVIVLDTTDIPYEVDEEGKLKYHGQWYYAFSSRQFDWLVQEALALGDRPDWRVLFASHVQPMYDGVFGTDHRVRNEEAMWGIIDAFAKGAAFSSSGGEAPFDYTIEADFSVQGPRTVIGYLFGHVHFDQVLYRSGIPVISTLNANTHRDFPEAPERIADTMSAIAFDLVAVDFDRSALIARRVGAGEHRVIEFGPRAPSL
ncbi:metallophosphoesterase family protein [Cohnella hongkongensis]|uniref:Metallophosphoesterase family protein n=1 Tax=Cohnella hongkongensis TaxID=178337 RepID=A0ABV9FC59_9BACL